MRPLKHKMCYPDELILFLFELKKGFSAFVASLSYFASGEVRSWSSSGVPSLQGLDGLNATLSQGPLPVEIASWTSKLNF
jgi:hypothetical protein